MRDKVAVRVGPRGGKLDFKVGVYLTVCCVKVRMGWTEKNDRDSSVRQQEKVLIVFDRALKLSLFEYTFSIQSLCIQATCHIADYNFMCVSSAARWSCVS